MFDFFKQFTIDWWTLLGLIAQSMYFLRFVIQLIASEKAKKTTIPPIFWYLSIAGGIMILFYAIQRKDLVFIVGQGVALYIYTRNLIIDKRSDKIKAD